jgi:hypothetical protein
MSRPALKIVVIVVTDRLTRFADGCAHLTVWGVTALSLAASANAQKCCIGV